MGFFEDIRLRGIKRQEEEKIIDISDDYRVAIREAEEQVIKGMGGKDKHYSVPLFETMSINPDYKMKPSTRNAQDLHNQLKRYSTGNIILNSIINTRANQVSMYCRPARYSEHGIGYKVALKDISDKGNKYTEAEIRRIEKFLENMGVEKSLNRDSLTNFVKKIVRDTYRYDQVNFEKTFDRQGNLHHISSVDASTIYIATDKEGKPLKKGQRYVQVLDNRIVARFTDRELAFAIRNPRTDIEVGGYGLSELEIALKQFIAHDNTENFNDRFFSHGGTTRGVLQIKTGQDQSQHALDIFRREWRNSLSGINGSWQIPVISAEDVKFVNMTPSGRDMEFEKWLNYLINVITALYGIDPSEINFPNNGGATGSKGGALNEGNAKDKFQASQNKGLQPLLRFIEETINTHIISEFGDRYLFQFVGGDAESELEKIEVLAQKTKVAMTVNEAREALGLKGNIPGGDVIMNGVHIQRLGQLIQEEQAKEQLRQQNLSMLLEAIETPTGLAELPDDLDDNTVEELDVPEDEEQYSTEKSDQAPDEVGKDGQLKNQKNTNGTAKNLNKED